MRAILPTFPDARVPQAQGAGGQIWLADQRPDFWRARPEKIRRVAKDRAPKFSFDEGLQVLPDTLAAQLGDAVKLNTTVTKLMQTTDGWVLTVRTGVSLNVISTSNSNSKWNRTQRGDLLRHGVNWRSCK